MTQSYRQIEAAIAAHYPNIHEVYVTSTTGGGHASTSYHYRGMAVDYGASTQAAKDRLAVWLYQFAPDILELIHTKSSLSAGGWYVKNRRKVSNTFYSPQLRREHINHVHIAMDRAGVSAMVAKINNSSPTPTLRTGAVGSPVTTLQNSLNTAGAIPHLAPDGDFGPATEHAVKVFQSTHGLTPDGVVGPLTWRALGS